MFQNYLHIALRNLNKHKSGALINLLGLTLGITACLAIYTITNFELSYDTFHPDNKRIYRLVGEGKFGKSDEFKPLGFAPRAVPNAIREEVSGLETVAAFHNLETQVLVPGESGEPKHFERRDMAGGKAQIIVAEPQYFDIFQYEWLAGNPQTALNEPNAVVLSESKARLYFGDIPVQEMLGKTLIYRDFIQATVTGIVREWEGNTDFSFTDFLSYGTISASPLKKEINLDEWNDVWSASQAFVKLAPGTTAAQVEVQLAAFSQNHFGPDRGTGDFLFIPKLQPLSDLHFNEDYRDNYSRKAHLPTLYGLMGVALFILLIAVINFINLSTAQSAQRMQEIGMRKVLGGSRSTLMGQLMGETFLLTALAAGVSVFAVPLTLSVFRAFIPEGIEFSFASPRTLSFLLAVTVVTALLSGFYPAWVLSSYRPAVTLKGQNALRGNQKGYLRKGLIVFQFALSLMFIIGAIVVEYQLNFIRNKDLGFSSDAVVLINTPHDDKSRVLGEKIRQLAGVDRVAMQWFAPMGDGFMLTKMKYSSGSTNLELDVSAKIGDENFIPLYGLRFLAGRNFIPGGDTLREIVINQTFAATLGFRQAADAVGAVLDFNGEKCPVAGVVADFHEQPLHVAIQPTFIAYMPQLSKNIAVKLATKGKQLSDATATLAGIRQQWEAVYPGKKFEFTFLDDGIAKIYEKERKTGQLVGAASAIAILISCMGLFGLVAFTAEQRTKEIGVRKVLGASLSSIVALLSGDFLKLILIALVIASPVACFFMNKWLVNFAYRIDIQWWMFAAAGAVAVAVAFLTVGFQSVKAALANPVKSLRSE